MVSTDSLANVQLALLILCEKDLNTFRKKSISFLFFSRSHDDVVSVNTTYWVRYFCLVQVSGLLTIHKKTQLLQADFLLLETPDYFQIFSKYSCIHWFLVYLCVN